MITIDPEITGGSGEGTLKSNCVMEHVSLLWLMERGIITHDELLFCKTDNPSCTADYIVFVAQHLNDCLNTEERQALRAFIPRLLNEARESSDPKQARRIETKVVYKVLRRLYKDAPKWEQELLEAAIEANDTGGDIRGMDFANEIYKTYQEHDIPDDSDAHKRCEATQHVAIGTTQNAIPAVVDYDLMILDELLELHQKELAEEGLLGMEDVYRDEAEAQVVEMIANNPDLLDEYLNEGYEEEWRTE